MKTTVELVCPVCKNTFRRQPCHIVSPVPCCSLSCRHEYQRGKTQTPESNEKRRQAMKGHVFSEEHNKKISITRTGMSFSPEHRARISKGKKNPSQETRKRLSSNHADVSKENNPRWKGGISFEPYCPKWTEDLRIRIRAFFDNQCVACGKSSIENKKNLSCHHVEYNKKACCDGKLVQFAALCNKHHSKTNEDRDRWEAMLHRVINEIWEGRSYYTKEEWVRINGL